MPGYRVSADNPVRIGNFLTRKPVYASFVRMVHLMLGHARNARIQSRKAFGIPKEQRAVVLSQIISLDHLPVLGRTAFRAIGFEEAFLFPRGRDIA